MPFLLVAGKLLTGAIAAVTVVAAVVMICYANVMRRLRVHKRHNKDIGRLVRTELDNGNFKVVGSVLSRRPLGIFPRHVQHQKVFEGRLDAQMERFSTGETG